MAIVKHTEGGVSVEIEAPREEVGVDYDDDTFLRADERFRAEISDYLQAGARIGNLAEVLAQVVGEELG
jgi:hypothetical protein